MESALYTNMDDVPLLQNNILLHFYSDKSNKNMELMLNDKYIACADFKNGAFLDTGLEKGTRIKYIYVKLGYVSSSGYYFKVQRRVEEDLSLELYKGKLTLEGREPKIMSDPTCLLS